MDAVGAATGAVAGAVVAGADQAVKQEASRAAPKMQVDRDAKIRDFMRFSRDSNSEIVPTKNLATTDGVLSCFISRL